MWFMRKSIILRKNTEKIVLAKDSKVMMQEESVREVLLPCYNGLQTMKGIQNEFKAVKCTTQV